MRGVTFVTRKISQAVSKIMAGKQDLLSLGNMDAKRDWGYAPEFVEGMWRMLQAEKPDDFVLATNQTHTVREFVEEAFRVLGEEVYWKGEGVNEKGYIKTRSAPVVEINPRYYRPTEVDLLLGDYSKAKKVLGWEPRVTFKELVRIMVEADFRKVTQTSGK